MSSTTLRRSRPEVNIPAIIGFISLMGISTRNGMLLMSRYNDLHAHGIPLAERVMKGSADRLLPIVMTALTSALALLPLAINGDKPVLAMTDDIIVWKSGEGWPAEHTGVRNERDADRISVCSFICFLYVGS